MTGTPIGYFASPVSTETRNCEDRHGDTCGAMVVVVTGWGCDGTMVVVASGIVVVGGADIMVVELVVGNDDVPELADE